MKLLIITIILALILTTVFICIVKKTIGRSAPLALACAVVLAVFIAPVAAAQFVAGMVLVTVLFLAISE